jgi:hypothetical protein
LGVGLTALPCKRENVEKPPRNSAGFCGGGQGLSWAVEPRKEEEEEEEEVKRLRRIKSYCDSNQAAIFLEHQRRQRTKDVQRYVC